MEFFFQHEQEDYTIEHHYIFIYAPINYQLQELNNQFSKNIVQLFIINSSLIFERYTTFFRLDDIYLLINKFYLQEFIIHEKLFVEM